MSPRTTEQFEKIREDRKERLLNAAFTVFSEEGYHNSSISKIAKKAKVSKGLLYNYFESKEALLRAIMRNMLDEVEAFFEFGNIEELNEEEVFDWIDKSFDIVLDDIPRWKLYIHLSMQPDVMPIFMEMAGETIQTFSQKFYVFFEKKGVKEPLHAVRYFSALVDGIQLHLMLDPENFPLEHAKKQLKDHLLNLN